MRGVYGKLNVQSEEFVCSYCSNPGAEINHLDTLGKIVCTRCHRFFHAPCCNTVQIYNGQGDEYYEEYSKILLGSVCHAHIRSPGLDGG